MTPRRTARVLLTGRALARHLEVDESSVRQGRRSGRLNRCVVRRGDRVLYDLEIAAVEWIENADPVRVAIAAERSANGTSADIPDDDLPAPGRLVEARVVVRVERERERVILGSLGNAMRRLAPRLAHETDAGRIAGLLEGALAGGWISAEEAFNEITWEDATP